MPSFLVFGSVFTLLILGVGTFAWRRMGQTSGGGTKQARSRAEARRLQARFDEDEDFASNFHRPTQNEVLETLQMLDHLTPTWDQGAGSLIEWRLKNELAESFPTLRKHGCAYPQTAAQETLLPLEGTKVSPETWQAQIQSRTVALARCRAEFQHERAHANALHQLTTAQDTPPAEEGLDHLPFHVSEDPAPRRFGGALKLLGASALASGLALLAWHVVSTKSTWSSRKSPLLAVAEVSTGAYPPDPANEITVASSASAVNPDQPPAAPVEAPNVSPENGAVPEAAAVPTPAADAGMVQASPPPLALPAANAVAAATPPPPSRETLLAQRIAESKLRAVDKHPDLMVPNSEINLRFVFRYKTLLTEKSPRLQDPQWPEKLADECAGTAGSESRRKKITQFIAPR